MCLVLLDVATGFFLSGAITDQANELATGRKYLREQMANHAVTLAKNLSLSASILADTQSEERETLETEVMAQLTVASHFSEDLLFLELWSRDGTLLIDDRDTLYLGSHADTARPREASAALLERILTRNTTLAEPTLASGQPFIEVVVPVHRRGAHVGALRVGVSEAKLFEQLARIEARHAEEINDIIIYSLLSFIFLFLAAAGASIWLSRRLAQPLVELTRTAEAVREGNLDVEVSVGPRDEIGQLASTMAEMIQGLRDRDFIQETLGRYVDPSVAQRFLEDPTQLALGGSSREVTIIMSDLRGFSRMAQRLGPEETVHTLNRYFTAMFAVIHHHGGLINEVRGDGLLILFGVPEATPDSPARAIACAVDMQRAMIAFNAEGARQDLPQLEMGIGIHRGRVIAGNIGSKQRAKFGVVGDTINLAARIESLTRAGEVFVSGAVLEGLETRTETEGPNRVRLKGQAEPIEIYSVLRFDDLELPPREDEEVEARAVDLPVELYGIRDKRVDEEAVSGRIVEMAGERLELVLEEEHAETREWLARVNLPNGGVTGDIYLKAVADADPRDDNSKTVFITSILDEDRQTLEGLGNVLNAPT